MDGINAYLFRLFGAVQFEAAISVKQDKIYPFNLCALYHVLNFIFGQYDAIPFALHSYNSGHIIAVSYMVFIAVMSHKGQVRKQAEAPALQNFNRVCGGGMFNGSHKFKFVPPYGAAGFLTK